MSGPQVPEGGKPGLLHRFLVAYRKASGGSLLLSIVLHSIILIIGVFLVVSQVVEERKISFGGGEPGSKDNLEHKVQAKRKTTSAPAPTKRITTTSSIAKVALPDMPDIPMSMGPSVAGAMGTGGFGASSGLGGGGGKGSGAGSGGGFSKISFFGLRGGSTIDGFVGTFFDLKQKPGGNPTKMELSAAEKAAPAAVLAGAENTEYIDTVKRFSKTWGKGLLNTFFKAPQKLVNHQFIIPDMGAEVAPEAFGVEKECVPRRWIAYYAATIIPPRDGRFRFRGCGDDVLLVRCNGQNVFDGSLRDYCRDVNTYTAKSRTEFAGGKWLSMKKGVPIKTEIIIGECPGGHFYAFLCLEEEGVEYPSGFPVFQLKAGPVPPVAGGFPVGRETIVFGVQAGKPDSLLSAFDQ